MRVELKLNRDPHGAWSTSMDSTTGTSKSIPWPFHDAAKSAACMAADTYIQMVHDAIHAGAEVHITFDFREPGPVIQ